MKQIGQHKSEQGVVSLFVVIFSALLVTIVTVGFIQLMLRTQQEASTVDLSQSAYDSALAGVADAKRAIVLAEQKNSADNALNSNQCNSVAVALGQGGSSKETLVRQDTSVNGDTKLDQAYTCVKVTRDTVDVRDDNLNPGASHLIPLRGVANFSKVRISWGLPRQDDGSARTPTIRDDSSVLPRSSEWGIDTPALLRTQLIQYGSSLSLSDFDSGSDGTPSNNSQTQFLYPATIGLPQYSFSNGNQASPTAVECSSDATVIYSCQVTLTLPNPKNGSASDRKAFLRMDALYNNASYRIELIDDSGKVVKFSNVQAKVDSTGRAGDVFRRVDAVVNLQITKFPYPNAAIDLEGNLCKTFRVTNKASDYDAGACKPYDTSGN